MSSTILNLVKTLNLKPHPEGGWYRETFRDEKTQAKRSVSTAIYYLLEAGDTSEWHRVKDAAEVWHYYAGAPLVLTLSADGHDASAHRLGPNIDAHEEPQIVVPAGCWQTATSLGEYTLVGCTVAPGFDFSKFERAPKDWRPTPRESGSEPARTAAGRHPASSAAQ